MSWIWNLSQIPRGLLWGLTLVGLVGSGIFGPKATPRGLPQLTMVEFEVCWDSEHAQKLMGGWTDDVRSEVRRAVRADFFFIIAYVLLLMGLVLLSAREASDETRGLGVGLALAPVLAGLFDVVENLCLFQVLDRPAQPSPTAIVAASTLATLKFALIFGCAVYVVIIGGGALFRFARHLFGM